MRRLLSCLIAASCAAVLAAQTRTTLDIYLIDVEGGNATLFVAPSGETLLIDTGNGGPAAGRGGAPNPPARAAPGDPAPHRPRRWRPRRRARRQPHPRRRERRRRHPDRSSDHHALAR